MAMSTGSGGEDKPMSDINTTPLVDVMLVLLIIFLIAVPVVIQTVKVNLPKVPFQPTTTKPENVSLTVTNTGGKCDVYWNLTRVGSRDLLDRGVAKLKRDIEKAGGAANMNPDDLPEVHIRGDINTPWRCIAGTIYTMQLAGFPKVGFISQPDPGSISVRRL